MKKLTNKEELQILNECINDGKCNKLVRYYWNTVFFTVRKTFILKGVSFTDSDINDMQNEVFLQLFDNRYRKLMQYEEDAGLSLANWIRMIASQTVLMSLRKKDPLSHSAQSRRISFDKLKENSESENRESSPEFIRMSSPAEDMKELIKWFEDRETLTRVLAHLEKLPHREQLVLKLHFLNGLSFKKIASDMKESINNIYTIKSRAISRLKKLMIESDA